MTEKLKPCPFCGGKPLDVFVSDPTDHKSGYQIFCAATECDIQPETHLYKTISEAIAAWNTRKGDEK